MKSGKPAIVARCEIMIYACMGVSALASLVNRWSGVVSPGQFGGNLMVYALLCMIPYKLGQGSNPTRYVYVIINVLALFLMLGGGLAMPKLDVVVSVVMIPVEIYVSWALFQPAVSRWFTGDGDDAGEGGPPSWASRSR